MRAHPAVPRLAVLLAAIVALGGCGSATLLPTPSPTATLRLSPAPTGSPGHATPSATPSVPAHWEQGPGMRLGRYAPQAVPYGSGGALVVGNDTGDCVRASSVITETFELGTEYQEWSSWTELANPGADFAVVPLRDGRVLATGGVDRGKTPALYRLVETIPGERPPDAGHRSSAKTWVFASDPATGDPAWLPAAPLGTPRTAPGAATLPDGRVLVVGGYFLGPARTDVDIDDGPATGARLAVFGGNGDARTVPGGPVLANDGPSPSLVAAIATAELYDPVTDTWAETGPLRYARYDPAIATLADGRVLVVGVGGSQYSTHWNFTWIVTADGARDGAEIYDPATGRFGPAGELPPIDWSALNAAGVANAYVEDQLDNGTLVALPDGGALLVARADRWQGDGASGGIVRTLRFDPVAGQWRVIDQVLEIGSSDGSAKRGPIGEGHVNLRPQVGVLPDGRVLIAGGEHVSGAGVTAVDTAELFDPGSGTWTSLPPMPQQRTSGAAVTLGDGSVLIVGGAYETARSWDCADGPTGLVSTVRFVPGS